MELPNRYEIMNMFSFTLPSERVTTPELTFQNLRVVPSDFVQIPQMYVGTWKKSSSHSLSLGGGVLTGVGAIGVIVTVTLFFSSS
jgi:hypothetical protein